MMNKSLKTKIAVSSVALIAAAVAIAATVVGYQDWQVRATPGNPASGYYRSWANGGVINCKDSTGATCTFAAGSGITLQTNGTPNGSQSLLNLIGGSNITVADNGTGGVTLSSSAVSSVTRAIGMAFGNTSGAALIAGETQYVTVPFACTVKGWSITVDQGTATVDIWKKAAAPVDWSGASGTVNTSGTTVTKTAGTAFPADAAGLTITINSVVYVIASVTSSTVLVLTTSAGTQTGVAFAGPASSIPSVANTIVSGSAPAVSSGTFAGSTSLSGWTTAVIKNDVFGFHLNAAGGSVAALSIVLECQQ